MHTLLLIFLSLFPSLAFPQVGAGSSQNPGFPSCGYVISCSRANVLPGAAQSTSATPVNLIAAQGAGKSTDLISLFVTSETATACVLSVSDGTKTYKFNTGANAGSGFMYAPPVPVPTSNMNTAWTLTGCAAVTLDAVGQFLIVGP
jgi:hypothetical protein